MPPLYSGLFEAHITVEPLDKKANNLFREFCGCLKIKPIRIELPCGDHPVQPMTCSNHQGNLLSVRQEVAQLAQQLLSEGFKPIRQKIEAAPFNRDVPVTLADVAKQQLGNYFEYHLKFLFENRSKNDLIQNVCMAHGAHLSRNAFERFSDGSKTYFITSRCYDVGLEAATIRFRALRQSIAELNLHTLKSVTEYCVYDDHLGLDANWLPM